ncbi:MAG: alkaline phosphatase family protein [Clostridiaceae bacterium]
MKTFIFGIDGGTFSIIKPLLDKGFLPNIKKLIDSGASGNLISTVPPHTAPGWASAITGVNPGSHGIYQFWDTQSSEYVGKYMGSTDFGVPTLWEILNKNGMKTGMVNVPMTHPPKPVDGFIITWPLSKTLRYSYPSNILSEIANSGGHYLPDLYTMFKGDLEYINEAIEITKNRAKTIIHLIKKYPTDFFMTVFPEVDRISHYYWHFFDEKSPDYSNSVDNIKLRSAISDIYIATDYAIGEILKALDDKCSIYLISDHGFGCGMLNFYLHNFLKDKGYLNVKYSEHNGEKCSSKSCYELADGDWLNFEEENSEFTVDWENTKAYMSAPGSYGININLKGRQKNGVVSQEEFDEVSKQLIKLLMEVKNPISGEDLFSKIVPSKEVYKGSLLKYAPDLILIPKDFGTMVHHQLTSSGWFSNPEQKGMHREEGIIIASGPDIKKCSIQNAHLEDIVPTLLYQLRMPIPNYIEGDVLSIFKNEFNESNKIEIIEENPHGINTRGSGYSDSENIEIQEKLKSLGYL